MRYILIPRLCVNKLDEEESRMVRTDSLFCDRGMLGSSYDIKGTSDNEIRTIVICDSDDMASRCERDKTAYIFYDPCGNSFGHKYILTSIMGLYTDELCPDTDYLDEVYLRFHGLPLTVIRTERTYIREVSKRDVEADVAALMKIYEGVSVTDYIEPLYPFEEEVEYEKKYIENIYGFYGYGMWLVCEKDTDEVIGRAGIETRDGMDSDTVELGYMIEASHQRKGYASEVCIAIIDYAVNILGKSRIVSRVDSDNTASVALMRRLGFKNKTPRPEEMAAVGDDLFFEKIDF